MNVERDRPLLRMAAFAALGLYGALRWATLTPGQGNGRVLGLLVLALAVAGLGPAVARRSRLLTVLLAVLAALAALAVGGIPLSWITHLRVSVTGQWIGNGVADLPGVLVPYLGSSQWVLIVITLGAAVLLLDGAIVMAFAPPHLGALRRAVAALPLVALVAIPATLNHSRFPYLEGLALFALLSVFLWGERVRRERVAAVIVLCAVAAGAALALAPALRADRPWLDYQGLTNSLTPGAGAESFDWSQRYGPINWPRNGKPVLQVTAARGDYWKAQNLDAFDGTAWTQGVIPGAQQVPPPSSSAFARWSEPIGVRIRNMTTTDLVGAGTVFVLSHLPKPVVPGASPGTWTSTSALRPGDSYQAVVYSPHPNPAELAAAGTDYSGLPAGYRMLQLHPGSAEVVFGAFGSGQEPLEASGSQTVAGQGAVAASPYARVFSLAQHLAAQAQTPYEYVQNVLAYLRHGFTYNENPPSRTYPLESFLFVDKKGYCQQFAGAMALLLRMGGVPARVAAGFTPGTYNSANHSWVVSDTDAHAWVEAWFPHYGWVRFDPTPGADPALQNVATSLPSLTPSKAPPPARPSRVRPHATPPPPVNPDHPLGVTRPAAATGRGGSVLAGALFAVALALAALWMLLTRPLTGGDAAVVEVDRAFARSGRPLPAGVTLAELEHRLRGSPDAAAYVQRLRLSRFAGGQRMPSTAQRRALREHLASGLGLPGKLRALWALPPRRRSPSRPDPA
ncbi:MAG TPA: transglutaminase-like domain-containing protein [Solirubrobacteraceae bacterium]|nr:transglutaminase-like domain-containing protein [Solirubrobacteraceae bacterium]